MEALANEYQTTLAESISDSDTAFDVADAPPAALSGGNFRIRLGGTGDTPEYVLVGTVSGSTLSGCTRGVEGSTAASWTTGDEVRNVLTVAGLADAVSSGGGGGGSGLTSALTSYLLTSGSARNDEFDGGPSLDGKWSLAGNAVDTVDVNSTLAERLYLRRNDTGSKISIYYQDLPSFPCDITCHVAASTYNANYARGGGLCLLPASPTDSSGALFYGFLYNAGFRIEGALYSNLSTYSATPGASAPAIYNANGVWVRFTVLSGGTTVDIYWSLDGIFWVLSVAGQSLGFTAANGGVGFAPEGQSTDLECAFDYYRVSA